MKAKIAFWMRFIFWQLSVLFVATVLSSRFRLRREKGSDPMPPRPYIVVANHATFFDPWLVGYNSFYPLSIMMNDEGFRASPFTRWYLRSIGAFPKKKGAHDFKAMKMTINFLRNRTPVLIFPEGQTTWDGETQPIYRGIEKILKKTGCSLVIMRLQGNFLSKPWWADTFRTGRVTIGIKALEPQRIAAMSDEALLDTIRTGIYNNDIKNPLNQSVRFTGKDCAAGLERFVWMCMQCEHEDTLATQGDIIRCGACGGSWRLDPHCRLTAEKESLRCLADLKDWSEWHKVKVRERIASAQGRALLTVSENVVMQTEDESRRIVEAGSGTLRLFREALSFSSVGQGGLEQRFNIREIADYVFQRKDIFEFLHQQRTYRFVFDRHSPMKWLYYLRYMSGYEECEKRGVI
jgi:1-acyl-sn-glycerol-3-phosphate acyltransferase